MKTILLIEDDLDLSEYIQLYLEGMEYRVFRAADGERGFEIAETHGPDLILLDIHLPGKNGLQILQQLKSHDALGGTPIIMMTTDSRRETVSRSIGIGATDYLVKPLNMELLAAKLAKTLEMIDQARQSGTQGHKSRVKLDRKSGETAFVFTGSLSADSVDQIREYFTEYLQLQTKRDYLILDLRYQYGFEDESLGEFKKILKIFAPKKPRILAGKFYAELLALEIDFESQLFISQEDMEKFFGSRRPGEVD